MKRNRTMCNIKIDENNCLKHSPVSKKCYDKNRRNNNINTLIKSQQSKSDNNNDNDKKKKNVNSVNNQTLITRFLNCRKTYLMNHILHQKQ